MRIPLGVFQLSLVCLAAAKVEKHAEAIASGDINVDDMVGLMEGQRSFEANLAVVKTGDQMIGTLLDMFA